MLEKWKKILTNWINCYFYEGDKKDLPVTLGSLIDIISHLRENFNLDESKSSLLEAHTVHEFIVEKYPDFKFENGTAEPVNETEVHIAASLLLYFVCVNSKDVDIKNAMCKNLSVDNQEIILKFSKCLLACSHISCDDVMTAIKDACGQDVARTSLDHFSVSETPPALRSLHNEVRRLQATLEAERFDRNYLQDELSRTNLKLEKLVKDKEQYKLEVLNLKAKISLCCGENKQAESSEPTVNNSDKLLKQLEQAEERLVNVHEQLDDAQHERDVYQSKLEESKREYEKLLSLSQQETSRASQLAEELETERHHTQSLRELVSELRQHNRLNGMDTSQFECDDLDASIHSPQHNLSVCSEVCANVIEVQLSEERAKIVVLKGQIQELQDQLSNFNKKFEDEKQTFLNITSEKDNEIINLKHRINEETEDKNNLKLHLNNELDRLKSDINELEMKLKETNENSQRVIESKMQEIQILQEEKLSLLQSLANESNKLENIIKNLQRDVEVEKASKNKMREDYDNHIMKLNEKVLNRSNELFELQNKIVDNGERIEHLQFELKKEKEIKDDMSNRHNNDIVNLNEQRAAVENELKRKSVELLEVQMELKQQIDVNTSLKMEFDHLKNCYTKSQEDVKVLEDNKERLFNDIKSRDIMIEKVQKDIGNLKFECQATIDTLKSQLQDEIHFKLGLQESISTMEKAILDKDNNIKEAEKNFKDISDKLHAEKLELQETIKQLSIKDAEKDQIIKEMKEQNIKDIQVMNDNISEKIKLIQINEIKLEMEIKERCTLQEKLKTVCDEKNSLIQNLNEKSANIHLHELEIKKLSAFIEENSRATEKLKDDLRTKTIMFDELQKDFNMETSKLNEMEKALKELKSKFETAAENSSLTIQTINMEKENLTKALQKAQDKIVTIENEKVLLTNQISEESSQKRVFEKEYLNKCAMLNNISTQLNNEIVKNNTEITRLSEKVNCLEKEKTQLSAEIKTLEWNLSQSIQKYKDIILKKDNDLQELRSRLTDLELVMTDLECKLNNETETKTQALEVLQQENSQLQFTLKEDNVSHKEIIKKMNDLIEKLKDTSNKLHSEKLGLKETIKQLSIKYAEKDQIIKALKEQNIKDIQVMNDNISEKTKIMKINENKLEMEIKEKCALQEKLKTICDENNTLIQNVNEKSAKIHLYELEIKKLSAIIEENNRVIETLKDDLRNKTIMFDELQKDFNSETTKVNEMQKALNKLKSKYDTTVENDASTIQTLNMEKDNLTKALQTAQEKLITAENEKVLLINQLSDESSQKNISEREHERKCAMLNNISTQFNDENVKNKAEITKLIIKVNDLEKEKSQMSAVMKTFDCNLSQTIQQHKETMLQKETDIQELKSRLTDLESLKTQLESKLEENKIRQEESMNEKNSLIEKLKDSSEKLHSDKSGLQETIKQLSIKDAEKDQIIKAMKEQNMKDIQIMNDNISEKIKLIQMNENKLEMERKEKSALQEKLKTVCDEKIALIQNLNDKSANIHLHEVEIKSACEKLSAIIEENNRVIETLKDSLKTKTIMLDELQKDFNSETTKLNETKKALKELKSKYEYTAENDASTIQTLNMEKENLTKALQEAQEKIVATENEKVLLINQLSDVSSQKSDLEKEYQNKCAMVNNISTQLNDEIDKSKAEITKLSEEVNDLEKQKTEMSAEIKNLECNLSQTIQQHKETVLKKDTDIQELRSRLTDLESVKTELESRLEVDKISHEESMNEKNSLIEKLKDISDQLHAEKSGLLETLKELSIKDAEKLQIIKAMKEQNIKDIQVLNDNISENSKLIQINENKLEMEIKEKRALQEKLKTVCDEKNSLIQNLNEKSANIHVHELEIKRISAFIEENSRATEKLKDGLRTKTIMFDELQKDFNMETSKLNEMEKSLKELKSKFETAAENDSLTIQTLNMEKDNLTKALQKAQEKIVTTENEKVFVINQLSEETSKKSVFEKEYLNKCAMLNNISTQLNNEIVKNDAEITKLSEKLNDLEREKTQMSAELKTFECNLSQTVQQHKETMLKKDTEIQELKLRLTDLESVKTELESKLKNETETKMQVIEVLQRENIQLQYTLEEDNINHEESMTERNSLIEKLEGHLCDIKQQLDIIKCDYDVDKNKWEKLIQIKEDEIINKEKHINDLTTKIKLLNEDINEKQKLIATLTFQNYNHRVAVASQEQSSHKYSDQVEKELRQLHDQVDSNSTDTYSSMECYKTIADLEKIVQDKNRTITTLQSDITYLKSLVAESENKLLDITKDLEMSKENCHQLSSQLKKIVHQKNEEISELKKQVSKMSATENRATQIIKVSAKYQAMILKRVAELKSNTILKELTNFGNATSCDNELRRNLNAGTITMEDLENFLETTDRHLKRCSEKQIALQKERDRLSEVSRINESEVINMRKFLTEISVSVKTFNSVKDLYSQKLIRIVSLQRTVRREILNLDGHITDATMCKLERGYAAVMQDLSECAMNMERWVERSIGRTISSEKIKQAFTSELDRVSLASTSFQNTSLEVQLEEIENSFQKLLEEVARAQKGEGAKDAQSLTVMEVRAEYEDKLNRMKAKMKQLYHEQISNFKEKQKEEIASLERDLEETRNKMEESSRAYQKHIRSLTTELWNVGEKFLMKKNEAEWLRTNQRSGSLMSLQHVHSSGLIAPQEEPSRPSDAHSLRSLPVNTNNNKENRGVHMSDEEGEVFDNRWLRELEGTPRAVRRPAQRLSELQWRNSLCPPHLKSSYPAETQFAPALHEEDIKCVGSMSLGGRTVRKEVGITAYKKPGPPTPSKQAGRLSATDSELRESLRVEAEPGASRKTSTPSRLRALFRASRNDNTDGTPRSRRISNIFRKK